MGSERASTTRQRERGQSCCHCSTVLAQPQGGVGHERACFWCEANAPIYRVLMHFMHVSRQPGWHISFFERDCKTVLPCRRVYPTSERVIEAARRGNAELDLHAQELDHGFNIGRGSIWLNLTRRQYLRLR